ncbi:MAG: hypothetical protein HYY18_03850 [Planctomycetes bacterium]|nr:hypothetical protein [Planctomycetota bacterium]
MPQPVKAVIGAAWYRADQWADLRAAMSDPDSLAERHEDWLATAEAMLAKMIRSGTHIERVDVDVPELVAWCREKGKVVDGSARSHFVAEKLRLRYKRSAKGDKP